ncbi:MAG: LTA synthase family protein [Lachnospiraceae bacterium]|nr:LTA synthase family protein [Lachnospiraceae bacterium]
MMLNVIYSFFWALISVYVLQLISKESLGRKEFIRAYLKNVFYISAISVVLCLCIRGINEKFFPFGDDLVVREMSGGLVLTFLLTTIITGIRVFVMKKATCIEVGESSGKVRNVVITVIASVLLLLGFAAFFSAQWYLDVYGDLGFDAVLFTLSAEKEGVQTDLILSYLKDGLLPALFVTLISGVLVLFGCRNKKYVVEGEKRKITLYPFTGTASVLISIVIFVCMFARASAMIGLTDYIEMAMNQSVIFEEKCVVPGEVEITFPEEKRNLIYIYMESMEVTFFSEEQGGALPYNVIPELYELADDNINFSHNDAVGGANVLPGSTWTIAAMVSHTTGIPLKLPVGINNNAYGYYVGDSFMPGVTSLSDILHENGYYQALMVGSISEFGGRDMFYTQHNTDTVFDLQSARDGGIVPQDYKVWWGMEDLHLYEYAKQELTNISEKDQPFAFTMLTVDTHHIDGYKCELCGDEYDEQYENVYACASRQLVEFISWIQEQDFYENTTIIISGDHCSMDEGYMSRNVDSEYVRRVYNCIINSAVDSEYTKNREFCTLDMFPTTLAAMGCEIEGERLGLGTNLFSGEKTLLEEMGYEAFVDELMRSSDYYTDTFLFP